jgi:hypothetical protein
MAKGRYFMSRTLIVTAYAIFVIFLPVFLSNHGLSQTGSASNQAETDRVVEAVDPLKKVTLTSHLPVWASRRSDLGPTSPSLKLDHLTILLSRSPQREQAFHELLEAQQNPRRRNSTNG